LLKDKGNYRVQCVVSRVRITLPVPFPSSLQNCTLYTRLSNTGLGLL